MEGGRGGKEEGKKEKRGGKEEGNRRERRKKEEAKRTASIEVGAVGAASVIRPFKHTHTHFHVAAFQPLATHFLLPYTLFN